MQAFIVYDTNYSSTILIGSYDRILNYVLCPQSHITEHYECNLVGETEKIVPGNIVLLASNNDMNETKERVYVFESAKQALRVMQRHHDWNFSRHDVVWVNPVSCDVSQPSEDAEPSGLSWQLEQAAMVKNFRTTKRDSQTEYADSLTALDLSKVYKQGDISMIERGLKFFPLQDWKTIKSLMV